MNTIDVYGQNAIYWSVSLGHLECCKLLKSFGSDHDHPDDLNQTPLFYAIKNNHVEIAEWLLSQGCNVKITDKRGSSLVQFASKHNR